MGDIRFPIGPVFHHCRLNFKQSSFAHTARVLPSLTSIVCQVSMAFPLCYFPPRLSAQGRVDDPGTVLLVPPGSARDTVMRDMAHDPQWVDRYGHRIEESRLPRTQQDREPVAEV